MSWVLIVWIHVGYGTAMTATEFSTEQACAEAGEKVVRSIPGGAISDPPLFSVNAIARLVNSGAWTCSKK